MKKQLILWSLFSLLVSCEKSETPNLAPNKPDNIVPLNSATCNSLTPSMSWEASDPERDRMTFTIWFGTDKEKLGVIKSNIDEPYYTTEEPLAPSTKYYWQIEVHDATSSTKGDIMSFGTEGLGVIGDLPSIPKALTPLQGLSAGDIHFTWEPSTKGDGEIVYNIYTKKSNASDFTLLKGDITTTSFHSEMEAGDWSWYVEAKDSRGQISRGQTNHITLY
ncbi:hypothetical protein OAT16_09000 [Prolixibacteraceae bacterium]|nr:hypothetical protein [Prolixibacteraceae bacterium]